MPHQPTTALVVVVPVLDDALPHGFLYHSFCLFIYFELTHQDRLDAFDAHDGLVYDESASYSEELPRSCQQDVMSFLFFFTLLAVILLLTFSGPQCA